MNRAIILDRSRIQLLTPQQFFKLFRRRLQRETFELRIRVDDFVDGRVDTWCIKQRVRQRRVGRQGRGGAHVIAEGAHSQRCDARHECPDLVDVRGLVVVVDQRDQFHRCALT